jgi:glycosyltransferase involved in cell wall biosynthesis
VQALDGAGVPRIVLRRPPWAYLGERRALARLLDREAPAIVHTHGYRADLQAFGIARSRSRAAVATVHGFTGGDLKLRAYKWLQRHALRQADAVVAVSRPIAEQIVRGGVSRERVHLIRNAWRRRSAPLARAEARTLLGLPQSGFVAGWIGRLSREKGPDVWLDAFSRLEDPESHTCFVGDGPDRRALAQRLRGSLAGRVHFAGEQPDAARLLSAFDVVVLSSRTEGTPIVLLEAMDALVPVVATAVGGVPDVLSDREGWLVPPDDPAALLAALEAVRTSPAAARMRAGAARDRLTRDLSFPAWLDAHEGLYRSITAR